MSQSGLLREKRFGPLFWTQFLGAFNDNVLKNAIVILFAFTAATEQEADTLVNVTAGVFILPFFLFSATAGQVADKLEKSRLIRLVKLFEVCIMAIATAGFAVHSVPLLLASLFLMGVHSTIFGPIKYSILPQVLGESELVGGNGLIEMGSFIAILLGTIVGGVAIAVPGQGPTIASAVLLVVALLGYVASRGIPVAAPTDARLVIRWNAFAETWSTLQLLRKNRTVMLSILGASWFWFYGALFLAQFPGLSKETLGGDASLVTLLLTMFSLGIGAGSMLCDRLSRANRARSGPVRLDRAERLRHRPLLRLRRLSQTRWHHRRARVRVAASRSPHPARPGAHRPLRRLLHRPALRAHPEAERAES
jgi:MFS family permease